MGPVGRRSPAGVLGRTLAAFPAAILVDDELAGFLDVESRDGAVFVGNIELAPATQCRGIGTEILRAIQVSASAEGKSVALQVLKVNPARRLYLRLGFTESGETDTHFQMQWRA